MLILIIVGLVIIIIIIIITKELIRVTQSQLYNYYWGTSIIVVHLLIESLGIRVYFY